MSQFHERYGLTPIINACGKMTHLGAAAVPPEVTSRVMEVMSEFVDMPALLKVADEAIADATGAEGGTVTHCAAAGITVTCAGAMTGDDLGKVLSLPDTTGMKNEVIIQKGHAVNFGAPITQMIRMTGATAVEFGEVNRALPDHMARAITANTAAAVFVLSHHTVQHNQLSFAEFVHVAASHNVPVIVDGAAEAFLARELLEQGAAAVVFSDQKHLNGFTAGVVAGSRDFIDATARQGMGLGTRHEADQRGNRERYRHHGVAAHLRPRRLRCRHGRQDRSRGRGNGRNSRRYGRRGAGHHRQPAGPRQDHRRSRRRRHDRGNGM